MRHTPLIGALLICLAGLLLLTGRMAQAQSSRPAVVISQIYGGGGNSGAVYTHDFIELFNRGQQPVFLAGWSVQYASAAGTVWQKTTLTGTLRPGGYFLIQQAQGRQGTRPLPRPDVVGTIPMSANRGKVALLDTTDLLPKGTACPDRASVIDLVGFGSTDCFEGPSPAHTLNSSTALVRDESSCAYTGSNSADFDTAPPFPRNSDTPALRCSRPLLSRFSPPFTPNQSRLTPTALTTILTPAVPPVSPTPAETGAAQISGTVQTQPIPLTPTVAARLSRSPNVSDTQGLVISQIYGGGGNGGATYTHDFVQLYNASPVTVELAGWSLQYASATGKTWLVTVLTGTVAPGDNYLVRQAQGRGGRLPIAKVDATGETAMSASRGKVALVWGVDSLTGMCPRQETIIDFVGYGNVDCFEGEGPAARPSNTQAIQRRMLEPVDTDDNSADFRLAPPEPNR